MNKPETNTHGPLMLITGPDKFYIHPIGNENELLVVDRVSHTIGLETNTGQLAVEGMFGRQIQGILGIINLLAGPYLVVVTRSTKIGQICNQPVYRVEETDVISYTRNTLHLTEEQVNYNNSYLTMVKTVLRTPYFYFSYSYDLTHSLQRLYNFGPDFIKASLFERAEHRFLWNHHLMKPLLNQPELSKYWLPLMHGFINISSVVLNRKVFHWIIISRRSNTRAGTRLFYRGADLQGNVANFVETEQIVEFENNRGSYVQIRGSIPLIWQQYPNLRYKPTPVLISNQMQQEVISKHIESLLPMYGKTVLVNLIDLKGGELGLENNLRHAVENLANPMVRYEHFEFHRECGKMRWDRLNILMERLSQEQKEFGYFLMLSDGNVASQQDGIFRTNCIDSLDRTNVVQSLIAKKNLTDLLLRFGILAHGERVEDHTTLYGLFRNIWADNADICSIEYAGTGALKTDYTRTGKRTQVGMIRDGMNSLIRYYKNNFTDGFRQDAIDLFLGKYVINENEGKTLPSPLRPRRDWKYLALPCIFLGSTAMFFFSLFIPTEHSTITMMYLLFWAAMIAGSATVIVYYGNEFVDVPRLCPIRRNESNN